MWTGLLVIGVMALGAGVLVAWPLLRGAPAQPPDPSPGDEELGELLAQRDQVYRTILESDFDFQAGKLSESDYRGLREAKEQEAVTILKSLDALEATRPRGQRPIPAPPPSRREAGAVRGGLLSPRAIAFAGTGIGLVMVGVAVGLLASDTFRPRPDAAMGGMAGMDMGPASATAGASPRGPVDPTLLEGMLRAAHAALEQGQVSQAATAYRAVLDRDPHNADALVHLGVILREAGELEAALISLNRALEIDPRHPHALWDLGQTLFRRQDYPGAIAAWERFLALGPTGKDAETARTWIASARRELEKAPPTGRRGQR